MSLVGSPPAAAVWIIAVGGTLAATLFLAHAAGAQDTLAQRQFSGVLELNCQEGRDLLVVRQSGAVVLFNAQTLEPLLTYYPNASTPASVAVHPTEGLVAVGLDDGNMTMIDAVNGSVTERVMASSSRGHGLTEMVWSPDGVYLAFADSVGRVVVVDRSLSTIAEFTKSEAGTMQWTDLAEAPALAYVVETGVLGLHFMNGTVRQFATGLVMSGAAPWHIWHDGQVVALHPPTSAQRLFVSMDYGQTIAGIGTLTDPSHDVISAATESLRFASFGSTSQRVILWNSDLLPTETIVINHRPSFVAWAASSRFVIWTTEGGGILLSIQANASSAPLGMGIDSPMNGTIITGPFVVHGTTRPLGRNGTVLVRMDFGGWYSKTSSGAWSLDLDSRLVVDGEHVIRAAFTDGDQFSAWASLTFIANNSIATKPYPVIVWFKEPAPGQVLSGTFSVTVGAANPNRQNGSVDYVEIGLGAGPWQRAIPGGRDWEFPLVTTSVSSGSIRLLARAFDGVAFSDPAWVDIVVNNPAPGDPLWILVEFPPDGSTQASEFLMGGTASQDSSNSVWVEYAIGGGPWIGAGARPGANGSWFVEVLPPGPGGQAWGICVRAARATALSGSECRTFVSGAGNQDNPPTVVIGEVVQAGSDGESSTLIASGTASDDRKVIAVLFRVDGGQWRLATGTTSWQTAEPIPPTASGNHRLEVMAFDGYQYSPIAFKEFGQGQPATNSHSPDLPTFSGVSVAVLLFIVLFSAAIILYWVRRRRSSDV